MKMKMKKTFFALLAASVAASASALVDNQKALESKVDSINAKRGVEIGGSIRAVAQASSFDTDDDVFGVNKMPDVERNEFVSADLKFGFRPYENVRANVMFRIGGGMQEYFAAAAKTFEAKWINVEGNIGKSFYWVIGDFRQQYSPLTIYNPGIDIIYEPTIFARKRYMAQKEQLLEGNQRNLQGVNLQFRQEIDPMIGEFRAEAIFARVNRVSVLDFSGAEGNILTNEDIAGATMASNTDKWLVAGNIELLPMHKNVFVGVTPMYIFDNKNTSSFTYRHPDPENFNPDDPTYNVYNIEKVNPFDTTAQKTLVVSGRAGADVAGLLNNKNLVLNLVGEYAFSSDKDAFDESVTGSALLFNMNLGYKMGSSLNANLTVDFIRNDEKWFNNLAQSPSFFAQRVLNSDKDGNTVKYGVNSPLYSTFDALYNYSPKFSPVTSSLGTNDDAIAAGQTESYNIAPYNKNSWGSNVYSRAQLQVLETLNDPSVQLSLPNGLATSNRMGAQVVAKFNWEESVDVTGMFSMFQLVKGDALVDKASFMEFGGGVKADLFKIAGFSKPLEISASYKHSERKADYLASSVTPLGLPGLTAELKSNFINAGFYAQYLPRLGVTAGFQMITTEINDVQAGTDALFTYDNVKFKTPIMKGTQMQWMVGLDYTIADNAWLSINAGMVTVENEYKLMGGKADSYTVTFDAAGNANPSKDWSFTSGERNSINLPDYYYNNASAPAASVTQKFTQSIFEASINVEF